jgi:signal transduction histidine kinase
MVPAQAIRDALVTHRTTYLGNRLNGDNLFYLPPELLLETGDPREGAKYAEWMCRQILRVLDAERARDEVLRDLERRVSERTTELAVANRHLRAFSYSVSHDLRAPLRAIIGFGAALMEESRDRLDVDGRTYLERMLDAAKRMGELIDGMLALGRVVEAGMRRVPIDLTALAHDAAGDIRAAEPIRSVELVVHEGLRTVGDPVLLRGDDQSSQQRMEVHGAAWRRTRRGWTAAGTRRWRLHLLRARQRRRVRHAMRRKAVRRLPAAAPRRRFSRHRCRPCHRRENRLATRRSDLGRESPW